MSTAFGPQDTFNGCSNPDVKIVLSGKPTDTLWLTSAVLAKESEVLRASLGQYESSYHKLDDEEDGEGTKTAYKLLELDYWGDSRLPQLVSKQANTPVEEPNSKTQEHDKFRKQHDNYYTLTGAMYESNTIINAYRIGLAMMYGLRIQLSSDEKFHATLSVPAVVDLLEIYGLLPAYNNKILEVVFGGSYDGYELIASDPFRFLKVACKLQSQVIYQEAMIHAVAIDNRLGAASSGKVCNPDWFAQEGEKQLFKQFKAHANTFHNQIGTIDRHLPHIQPLCAATYPAAREIGLGIFHKWVEENTTDSRDGFRSHCGIMKLLNKDFNIPLLIETYLPFKHVYTGHISYGHVHGVIESLFKQAHDFVKRVFEEGRKPIAAPRRRVGCLWIENPFAKQYFYYANIHFPNDYQYPWQSEGKTRLREFDPFGGPYAVGEFETVRVTFD